ncbi:MAG: DNA-3-methyladenine glycosylase [Candidatus Sulfotelmatobacter sp.]
MKTQPSEAGPISIRPLNRPFFARSPQRVARDLLGKVLVREPSIREACVHDNAVRLAARIVEVEAYLGANDPAAHAYAGHTPRNSVLFGPPGFAYVYFIYGNHYCLNVSCGREGKAGGGVLFRALEPLFGMEEMALARGISPLTQRDLPRLTSGPGRLAQAFSITRSRDNGADLTSPASSLWLGEDGFRAKNIRTTPRIGITKAADDLLRFILAGNPFLSGKKSLHQPT